MTVAGFTVIGVTWAAYFAYWAISSRSAAVAETVRRSGGSVAWLVAVVVAVVLLARFGYHVHIERPVVRPLGVGATVVGGVLSSWARRELGRHWNANVAIVAGQELVTSGPYAWIRHPIYTGFLLMAFGTALFIQEVTVFAIAVVLGIFLVVKARDEETLLRARFPGSYPAYRARTSALVPFVY